MAMGLGSFRWRLVILFLVLVLMWQTSKIWLAFLVDSPQVTSNNQDDPTREEVHTAVYYEALCPDSRSFILKQLMPTYRKLLTKLQVELVPYGKAKMVKTDDTYEFVCQHGPVECQANIVHACSIDVIKDPTTRLNFVACMIENNMEPMKIMNTCAESIPVDLKAIEKCSETEKGKELLAKYGQMTDSLSPRVSFIPTITINGSSEQQVKILKDLLKEVCLHFKVTPKECIS